MDATVGGGGNQAYSRLSNTHGHITDCKLDSVVYAGACVVICVNVGKRTKIRCSIAAML